MECYGKTSVVSRAHKCDYFRVRTYLCVVLIMQLQDSTLYRQFTYIPSDNLLPALNCTHEPLPPLPLTCRGKNKEGGKDSLGTVRATTRPFALCLRLLARRLGAFSRSTPLSLGIENARARTRHAYSIADDHACKMHMSAPGYESATHFFVALSSFFRSTFHFTKCISCVSLVNSDGSVAFA